MNAKSVTKDNLKKKKKCYRGRVAILNQSVYVETQTLCIYAQVKSRQGTKQNKTDKAKIICDFQIYTYQHANVQIHVCTFSYLYLD